MPHERILLQIQTLLNFPSLYHNAFQKRSIQNKAAFCSFRRHVVTKSHLFSTNSSYLSGLAITCPLVTSLNSVRRHRPTMLIIPVDASALHFLFIKDSPLTQKLDGLPTPFQEIVSNSKYRLGNGRSVSGVT